MKKYLYFFSFLFILSSCKSQESIIIEKRKINWQNYNHLYEDDEKEVFRKPYSDLENTEVFEIIYLSDSLKIQSFVAIPKNSNNRKLPVLIFNRGGNRNFGALELFKTPKKYHIARYFSQLANKGYVVMGCNYRGSGKSEGKDEFGGADVNDVLNLVELTKEIPNADSNNIGMIGWSRGAMMTLLSLSKVKNIKAVVIGGTPADLTKIDRPEMEKRVYSELIPNYWNNKDFELKKRSAFFFADELPRDIPILMLHGNADWRVKTKNALKLAIRFDELRIPYRLKVYEGADHSIIKFRKEVDQDILDWFNRYLKEKERVPNMDYVKP